MDAQVSSAPLWITLVGVAIPLLTLAGSAVAYVVRLNFDARERRRAQFFELVQFLDSDRPIATKLAAVYEMRRFPEHRDFIVRALGDISTQITGHAADILAAEMDRTRDFFKGK